MLPSLVTKYVDVVLPLPLRGTFTYSVPESMAEDISIGHRVIVPFGKHKFYTGIVSAFSPVAPRGYEVKEILSVLDKKPVLRHPQLKFWEWIAEYYLSSIGDVYKAAVPSGLKIESETVFEVNPDFDPEDAATLNERELMAWQLLSSKGKMSSKEMGKATGFKGMPQLMQRLVEKGVAIVSEALVERFRPKREKCVRLFIARGNEDKLREAFDKVKGAPKQEAMLMTMLQLSDFNNRAKPVSEVLMSTLLDKSRSTTAILKALVDKGIVERYTREVSRFEPLGVQISPMPSLSEAQSAALSEIHRSFIGKNIVLLHGVTSSGKTEVYINLIDYALRQGQQVLYLVPEIALTTQLTVRLKAYFGNRMVIYHSKFSDNERVEIWNRLLHTNEPMLIVGARSAVFLPFAKLGLVVVDEEHDQSYKQFDPAPRYNARDTAIMLAHMHGAKTLLGSATPAVETYYKALTGKYGIVSLTERYNVAKLPEIEIVDMAKARQKKAVEGALAIETSSVVRRALQAGHQAILFHNRRGYSPKVRCTKCQYIPKCTYCDVSLTYHRRSDRLVCHYCGTTYPMPEICPACKEPAIETVGYGTERVETEVENIFTEGKVLRLDLDSTRSKDSYTDIIDQFSQGKADILVGTQMVTKGLDFGNVSVVGVVNADSLLYFPDFRANERAFNMLEQVSGRAGRKEAEGKVMIQTNSPDHPVLKFVAAHDYKGFYEREIAERQAYSYPPFTRIIYIYLKHRDERELDNIAMIYGAKLRELFGTRVFGPSMPSVARAQSLYIRQIMLKVELNASMKKVKEILQNLQVEMHASTPAFRALTLYYDVDPY